jgi:dolichol kinase
MGKAAVPNLIRKTVQWLLLAVTGLFLITGFGITEIRVVETVTLGWLTKSWALKLHDNLWIPFVILLVLHVGLPLIFKRKAREIEL